MLPLVTLGILRIGESSYNLRHPMGAGGSGVPRWGENQTPTFSPRNSRINFFLLTSNYFAYSGVYPIDFYFKIWYPLTVVNVKVTQELTNLRFP